jgi:hypothetical protein
MMGLGVAMGSLERDRELLDGKNLSELVQTVAKCFSIQDSDATYEGSRALYEVS